jgi:hypothetical protein
VAALSISKGSNTGCRCSKTIRGMAEEKEDEKDGEEEEEEDILA